MKRPDCVGRAVATNLERSIDMGLSCDTSPRVTRRSRQAVEAVATEIVRASLGQDLRFARRLWPHLSLGYLRPELVRKL